MWGHRWSLMLLKIYPLQAKTWSSTLRRLSHPLCLCPCSLLSLSFSLTSTYFRTLSLNWVFWGACRERVFWAMHRSTPTSTVLLLLLFPWHTDLAGPLLCSCLIDWPSPNLSESHAVAPLLFLSVFLWIRITPAKLSWSCHIAREVQPWSGNIADTFQALVSVLHRLTV